MTFHWTFARKLAIGFALPALILAAVSIVGYRTILQISENDSWVRHTCEVQKQLDNVLASALDAETADT